MITMKNKLVNTFGTTCSIPAGIGVDNDSDSSSDESDVNEQ